jgi:type I restriction enzyme R subunit
VPGEAGPIKDKAALVVALELVIKEAEAFARASGVDVDAIISATPLERQKLIGNAIEALVAPDERRREFLRLVGAVERAYKALLPDERAAPYLKQVAMLHIVAGAVRAKIGPVDISAITAQIEALLDEKIEGVAILAPIIEGSQAEGRVDLSAIDFEKLAALFATKPKTATEKLREAAEEKATELAAVNPSRIDLVEKLEKMVDEYNAGAIDPQRFFDWLKEFVYQLREEGQRAAKEGLNESELAIFDLLTRPEPKLTKAQEIEVKKVARELLERLEVLVAAVDWTKGQQTRGAVFSEIRVKLNALPEDPYPEDVWNTKVSAVWDFVRQHYGAQPTGPAH